MGEESTISIPQRLLSFLRFSIAGYATICMGAGLVVMTLITWFVFNSEPQRVAWGDYIRWPQLFFLAGLVGLICFLTYWTVRLWNEDLPVREQSLEKAWQAGIEGLRKLGTPIQELPLFVVIGCQHEKAQESFLMQAGLRLTTEPIPKAPSSPLRWYLAEDRILLFLSDVGAFSATQGRLALHRQEELAAYRTAIERLSRDIGMSTTIDSSASQDTVQLSELHRRRMDASQSQPRPVSSLVGSPTHGARDRDSYGNDNDALGLGSQSSVGAAKLGDGSESHAIPASDVQVLESLRATEQLLVDFESEPTADDEAASAKGRIRQNPVSVLSSKEIIRQQALLEDTCRRLKVSRLNTAPLNGIVAWVDAPQLMDCARLSRQCGLALRRDATQIQEHLGVVAPVTLVLDKMQELGGFSELVRRMGQEKSMSASLGEAFELQRLPDPSALQSTCRRSITELTAAIYGCFRSTNGLGQPGNHKLFQLLVECRGRLGMVIESFVVEALSIHPQLPTVQEPALFGGIYFTASGDKPTHRGFGRPLLDRMMDQQEFLCWTKQRLHQEQRYRLVSWILSGVCLVLTVVLVGQIVMAAW